MLSYLLKTTLCWSLFYLLYHLWLGKETFFKINRWYLIGTAILGALIPLIDFQWLLPAHEEPMAMYYLQPISVGVDQLEGVIVTASSEGASFDWWGLLINAYWLGAAVAFGRLLFGLYKINKLYSEGERSGFNGYQFVMTSTFHVPFSFFRNLFWSKDFVVDEEDKQNILRHEEAHIFQGHSMDVILFEILGVLFWCSPFIYPYKKAIKTTHEYLADDYVVAQASRKKYGRLLLRQSQSGMPIAISNSLFSSQLKNRIVMMTKNKSNKLASLKYLATLPLLALLFLAFSFSSPNLQKAQKNFEDGLEIHTALDTIPGGEVFKIVEEMPVFSGCAEIPDKAKQKKCSDEKMMQFIFANLKYPKEAEEKGLEGMVVASFIIEKDGSIADAKIVRSIGGGCDEETLRVVNAMPNWTPGKQRGREVRVQYNLPIKFKLDAEAPIDNKEIKRADANSADGEIFKVVEDMPRFPGCEEMADAEQRKLCSQKKMMEFIFTNIKYPKEAREKGVEGMAVVQFIVEKDGSIADAEIIRSIGSGCDEEVLKVVYLMPNWVPGMQQGKAVRTQFNLPVKFKLDASASTAKDDPFKDLDEKPIMASCADLEGNARMKCSKEGLVNAVYSKIKYPKEAKEKKVEGTVIVKFTIDENGDVVKPEIAQSLGSGCDEEVLRVVSEMPKWIAGKKDGKPVAVELTLPVKFSLNGEDKVISIDDSKANEMPVVLKAFPNPATDKLSLEMKLDEGSYKLTMTDLNGKVVLSKNIQGSGDNTLNITDFPVKDAARGTLYVTITDEKGKVVKSSTVVLQ